MADMCYRMPTISWVALCGVFPQALPSGRPLRPCSARTGDLLPARCSLAETDPTLLASTVAWRDRGESPFVS